MRLLVLLLIATIVFGGVFDACADAHPDHLDPACLDDCCQPLYAADHGPPPAVTLLICERFACAGGSPNLDPLARTHFRPPETV